VVVSAQVDTRRVDAHAHAEEAGNEAATDPMAAGLLAVAQQSNLVAAGRLPKEAELRRGPTVLAVVAALGGVQDQAKHQAVVLVQGLGHCCLAKLVEACSLCRHHVFGAFEIGYALAARPVQLEVQLHWHQQREHGPHPHSVARCRCHLPAQPQDAEMSTMRLP
jgi:hypothetical protein